MTKDLATQLKELEDAEARLRPLVVEGRQLVKDLKRVEREVKESIEDLMEKSAKATDKEITDAIREHIARVVDRELDRVVSEIADTQHQLYGQVEQAFGKVARIFLGLEENDGRSLEELARTYAAGRAAKLVETNPLFGTPPRPKEQRR